MSELAHIADGLRELRDESARLDRRLDEAARELTQLRSHYAHQAARDPRPSGRGRRRLALIEEAERRVRQARAQLQHGGAEVARWLAAHAAEGEHADGGPPPPPPRLAGAAEADAVYQAVHRANARRLAGAPVEQVLDELEAELAPLDGDATHVRRTRAWQGEREGRRNAYDAELRDPEPDATYVVEGADGHVFQFETDARGRTVRARTTLRLLDQPRSQTQQREARRTKGGDADDDGGHLIANVFGGPSELINLVPQDWFQNERGSWRALEREWQQLLADGHEVEVQVEPVYEGASGRPSALVVVWAFRARGAPAPFEWVKDRVRIANDHAAGPRPRGGSRPGRG
ncbi:MAG: DNA/RNA non-specific endonuclease [Conexibacter sp.]